MNYLEIFIGHKFNGCGYAEILIETDLSTSGYLPSNLKGKSRKNTLLSEHYLRSNETFVI